MRCYDTRQTRDEEITHLPLPPPDLPGREGREGRIVCKGKEEEVKEGERRRKGEGGREETGETLQKNQLTTGRVYWRKENERERRGRVRLREEGSWRGRVG